MEFGNFVITLIHKKFKINVYYTLIPLTIHKKFAAVNYEISWSFMNSYVFYLFYTVYVFGYVLWCPSYIVCFSVSCVPNVPVSLDCPWLNDPSVLSNV